MADYVGRVALASRGKDFYSMGYSVVNRYQLTEVSAGEIIKALEVAIKQGHTGAVVSSFLDLLKQGAKIEIIVND